MLTSQKLGAWVAMGRGSGAWWGAMGSCRVLSAGGTGVALTGPWLALARGCSSGASLAPRYPSLPLKHTLALLMLTAVGSHRAEPLLVL